MRRSLEVFALVPFDPSLPLIADPGGVKRWLKRHPRFKMHFIPTSASWMNMVERWFAELTGKAVRRGSFASVPDLIEAIAQFIRQWNRNPQPFVWRARAEEILEKLAQLEQNALG